MKKYFAVLSISFFLFSCSSEEETTKANDNFDSNVSYQLDDSYDDIILDNVVFYGMETADIQLPLEDISVPLFRFDFGRDSRRNSKGHCKGFGMCNFIWFWEPNPTKPVIVTPKEEVVLIPIEYSDSNIKFQLVVKESSFDLTRTPLELPGDNTITIDKKEYYLKERVSLFDPLIGELGGYEFNFVRTLNN